MKKLFLLLSTITMVACTKTNVEPSRELDGIYEVDKIKITFGDGTKKVFSAENNTMLSQLLEFRGDSAYFYVLQDEEYIPSDRGVYCEWYRGKLLKVGCRQVIAYSSNHITWKQNDWLVTRTFK